MNDKSAWALAAILGSISLGAGGCAHQRAAEEPITISVTTGPATLEQTALAPAQPTQAAEPIVRNVEVSDAPELAAVHFDFDSDLIAPKESATLRQNADWLKAHEGVAIQVAGHCDQRGTVEYNLALGQRRASAVRTYYEMLGVDGARIATISYGKEAPLCDEPTEECWSKNRSAVSLKAAPTDIGGVPAAWPELAQLAARMMIEKHGPPQESSAVAMRWAAIAPWQEIIVHRDAAAPLEESVAYVVPSAKLAALREFGHGLSIDAYKGLLAARGDNETSIRLTLNLANEIAAGTMTPAQAERFFARTVELKKSGKSSPYTERLLF